MTDAPDRLAWEKLSEEPLRLGYRRMLRRVYRFPDGRTDVYDIKQERDAVTILGLTPENRVILARQFRPGPGRVLLELPGGGLEEGESPKEAALREFREETGYTGQPHFVGMSLDCAYSTLQRYNFAFTACRKVGDISPDGNEFIQPVELPLDEFRRHLRSGNLTDIETGYLCLDYLGLL